MQAEPFIIYEDNIIFSTLFSYENLDMGSTTSMDIKYFITPYGFFIPTDILTMSLLRYLKSPTEKNKEKLKGYMHHGFIVNRDGEIVYVSIGSSTNWKLFTVFVPSGRGVKSIHNTGNKKAEDLGPLLYMSRSYEEFLNYYDAHYDTIKVTSRHKLSDITKLLFAAGVNKDIEFCDLVMESSVDIK